MHIVITGARGQLGGLLAQALAADHTITGLDLPEFDVSGPGAADRLAALAPDLVIHCAAWTDVDGCARDPERALLVNAYGTKYAALACARVDAPLVHISSNEVFSGQAQRPYLEYDRTGDTANPYAYSKWVAEQMVLELWPKHYIVRPSWLISHGGRNFVQTVLRLAGSGRPLRIVGNEYAAPTYNDDLAAAIAQLIATGHYGIYHLVNEGHASRYALARFILKATGQPDYPVTPITLAQYPRASRPPERAILQNMAAAQLGITLRPWQEAVRAFLAREGLLAES